MGKKNILEYYKNVERLEDWKMFWHGNIGFYNGCELQRDVLYPLLKQDLGMFFWERGAKAFFKIMLDGRYTPDECIEYFRDNERFILTGKNNSFIATNYDIGRQDARDCLGCLEEEKVKELIKELVE